MSIAQTKDEALTRLKALVATFQSGKATFTRPAYSEAQLRIDFINPLLKTFGWDVENEAGVSQVFRSVIQEENLDVEDNEGEIRKKKPDYTLKIRGQRILFIEAKKSSIDIENSSEAAFQTRRYGWSAGLGVSFLTNFEKLVVYDCRHKPNSDDGPHVARYKVFTNDKYLENFDELYSLLSFDQINKGTIENFFSLSAPNTVTFDEYFLKQIEAWRISIANDLLENNERIIEEDINLLVQRLINRIIFLRICEDRDIEQYERLKSVKSYEELKEIFIASDRRYNSGLFEFIENDPTLTSHLSADLLLDIFNQLYYPESPYNFTVIEPNILSQIYERFLGNRLIINDHGAVELVNEPEVSASNGVIPTPKIVVDRIVQDTLSPVVKGKSFTQLKELKIADICCGSGTFLIGIYDFLLEFYKELIIEEDIEDDGVFYKGTGGAFYLTLETKRNIILDNIFGVDINPYAVEVAQFSLILKLLEDENHATVNDFEKLYHAPILPDFESNIKCGNSLVDETYYDFDQSINNSDDLLFKIRPFKWEDQFEFLTESGGFDVIIGNPPYVRVQNLVKHFGEEIEFYRKSSPGYSTASKDNFDKYYLFIERAINLLKSGGRLGYIVPNKFFVVTGGKQLRKYISEHASIEKIIHSGVTQIFPGRSTYTAILVLQKERRETFSFYRINSISAGEFAEPNPAIQYRNDDYAGEPWTFISPEARRIFGKMRSAGTKRLGEVAEIPVGVQTSADDLYVIRAFTEGENTISFSKDNRTWEVEKSILKDCFYKVSFDLFDIPKANAKIIFPYHVNGDEADPIQEDEMQRTYPLCWTYLNHYKDKLTKRSVSGGKQGLQTWYQYGRSQSLVEFHNRDKLIWSTLAIAPPYGLDQSNALFTGGGNGPYYSLIKTTEYSIYYLLGILAHPAIEAMVKSGASTFRGDYYSHGKQFLENLPIKEVNFDVPSEKAEYDHIVMEVQALIRSKQKIKSERNPTNKRLLQRRHDQRFSQLIQRINRLYGLTTTEVSIVSGPGLFAAETQTDE